ncbi:MAG: hypothetical protein RSA62_08010, partial [Oscillospiraceae bacterium]
ESKAKVEAPAETETIKASYDEETVKELIALAVAEALSKQSLQQQTQVVQVATQVPMVELLFQSEVAAENFIQFGANGKFGAITGKYGRFKVPKDAFLGEFRDALAQALLASRELIVLDGLSDEERELYGVKYDDGEIMDEDVFNKMLNIGDKLIDIYPALCQSNKDMIAQRFTGAFEQGDKRITRELVVSLNNLSRQASENDEQPQRGAFFGIIEAMNKLDSKQ